MDVDEKKASEVSFFFTPISRPHVDKDYAWEIIKFHIDKELMKMFVDSRGATLLCSVLWDVLGQTCIVHNNEQCV